MLNLLNNYSIQEILIFIVSLALAIRGAVDLYDWAKNRIRKPIDEEIEKEKQDEDLMNRVQSHEEAITETRKNQSEILRIVNILIDSDKDDIKAWITEKHHYFCYELGYIDDYSLQCIEARYKHYKDENGNTFIDKFMTDIRALPVVSVASKQVKE